MRGGAGVLGVCVALLAGCVSDGGVRQVGPIRHYLADRTVPSQMQAASTSARSTWQVGTVLKRTAPSAGSGGQEAWFPPDGRISDRWTDIIIHHSGTDVGGAARFDKFHRSGRGWDELGYHFVIGNGTDTPDGLVEVGSRWQKQKHGAHCKTESNYFNLHGIGICLVGDFQNHPPSSAQLSSLEKLIQFLLREAHIDRARIRTHGSVTGNTACPGYRFPSLARTDSSPQRDQLKPAHPLEPTRRLAAPAPAGR